MLSCVVNCYIPYRIVVVCIDANLNFMNQLHNQVEIDTTYRHMSHERA